MESQMENQKHFDYIQEVVNVFLSTVFLLIFSTWIKKKWKKTMIPEGMLRIPAVSGGLPFIGHGLYLFSDILKFVKKCESKYGGIFSVRLFRKNIVIVCDSSLSSVYFKEKEENMSLENILHELNFDWLLYQNDYGLHNGINIFKKSITVKYEEMIPKMVSEARNVIGRLGRMCDATSGGKFECTIEDEAYRFIARTSHACFLSGELKDEVLAQMRKLFGLVNTLIISSYFVPPYLMRKLTQWRVRQLQSYFNKYFKHVVQSYRDDPTKCDSLLIRSSVDFESPEHGRLSDADVTDLIVGFMFVSSENTSVGLANILSFMAAPENKAMFDLLRKECDDNMNDPAALLKGPILNACIMEMARLTAHLFSIHRMPMSHSSSIGPYHIGKEYDSVSVSGQMVMVQTEDAERTYHDALTFNPSRFLGKNKEPSNSPKIVTWGGGFHLCPGRMFALYEIKIALAHMVTNFNIEAVPRKGGYEFDYFTPIAFAKRKVRMVLSRRENKLM